MSAQEKENRGFKFWRFGTNLSHVSNLKIQSNRILNVDNEKLFACWD